MTNQIKPPNPNDLSYYAPPVCVKERSQCPSLRKQGEISH